MTAPQPPTLGLVVVDVVLYLVALVSSLASTVLLSRANRRHRLPLWARWPPERSPASLAAWLLALAAGLYAAARTDKWLGDALSYGLALAALVAPVLAVAALHNRRLARSGARLKGLTRPRGAR